MERLQNFRLYHSQDIKVGMVGKVAKFQTLFFSEYEGSEVRNVCKVERIRVYHFQDFQDIKVANVAKL